MVNPLSYQGLGFEYLQDDARWKYGVLPKRKCKLRLENYLDHAPRGMAGIVMSNGSLSTTKKEEKKAIREGMIADDKLDVIMLPEMFTNTGISACVWILSNDKKDPKPGQ